MKKLTEQIESLLSEGYKSGLGIMDLCRKFSLDKATIRNSLKKNSPEYLVNGRKRSDPKKVERVYQDVKELWDKGLGLSEIAEVVHKPTSRVSKMLYRLYGREKIIAEKRFIYTKKGRKWNVNEYYFEKIDTEDKAYLLGLLYADGCLSTKHSDVQLYVTENDIELIEMFNRYTEYDKPIETIDRPEIKGFDTEKKYYRKLMCGTKVTSTRFRFFCEKQGLSTKKSLILKFPTEEQVPVELQRHFIRGYFDGDGCITSIESDKYRAEANIASSKEFCESVKRVIEDKISVNCVVHRNKAGMHYMRIQGRYNIMKLSNWLYKNAELYLTRKRERFIEWGNSNVNYGHYGNNKKGSSCRSQGSDRIKIDFL